MNQHNVRYLAKILCLKAEVARNPYALIEREVIRRYSVETRYGDIVTVITVSHRLDNAVVVFQVFNEATVSYSPVEYDYGEPIIITQFPQVAHNRFPVSLLYIDLVESDQFPRFSRMDPETLKVVTSLLQSEDRRTDSLRLPRMLETEITAKILYRRDLPLKVVRFYKNNMVTGIEISDRLVANVIE
ncbi:RNA polymerase [Western grey kangaroopox virus]|uniref:DNA-directed RNA polymerase subunit n=2 Tax=Macropopoxvirus TaxID=2733295 RepID=A0A2C9DT43_9POXV|nr:RNA polymerase [Western grey kangaroopox virus]YP_010085366.1 RNA polymerase [Eastern grey kangaroopox virus]ATI21012.1 RNA polymerase [Western grey kangaroopox virus]ATI21176.1 RNA polymerase [Eastern grey kangaroopox virus]ATX75081.1 RNA polymerase [Eastern grey kangaroopox virus]